MRRDEARKTKLGTPSITVAALLLAWLSTAASGAGSSNEVETVRDIALDRDAAPTSQTHFDGRPIRPLKSMRMRVTAYSPDHRSCGIHADGITASGYSVETNAGRLVAADARLFAFGSLVSVPGYAQDAVVPVLDRGGAIKGNRLDVLYPTHDLAMRWGVKTVHVTVWAYDDGRPTGFVRPR